MITVFSEMPDEKALVVIDTPATQSVLELIADPGVKADDFLFRVKADQAAKP